MQARLAEAAEELYALPPGEFRAARDERADRARAAGDRELAGAIRKLRRPTVSAWLVNRLVRDAGDRVDELLQLGEDLHAAQSALAGDRLRELSERRRALVPVLAREARRLAEQAGQPVSDQAERELTGTLEAALADPAAASAVRSGRLTTALSYAGLGGPDAFAAVVAPGDAAGAAAGRTEAEAGRREQAGGRARAGGRRERAQAGRARSERAERAGPERGRAGGRARGEDKDRAERAGWTAEDRAAQAAADRAARAAEAARRDVADAEAMAREAADGLADAEQRAATSAGQHDAAVQRVADLERELAEAQSAEHRAARAAREARRSRELAARSLATAERRLARARQRADQG